MSDVLFLYLSREGQTRRIAECMAGELRHQGHSVELLALANNERCVEALSCCQHVVVGASIHYGHFPADLYAFIRNNCRALENRPNTFIAVNLTARKPGKDTAEGSAYIRRFLKESLWRPQVIGVFAGALLYSRYAWHERWIIRLIMWITKGPTDFSRDTDFTDWNRVRSFARSLFPRHPPSTGASAYVHGTDLPKLSPCPEDCATNTPDDR